MKNHKNVAIQKTLSLIVLFILFASLSIYVFALPTQPIIVHISNETSSSAGVGAPRAGDDGGYIITLNLNATQQNYWWKAYVGNVTGQLVLQDLDSFSIYEWDLGLNAFGNVLISRNGTVNWNNISCATESQKVSEDNFLSLNSTSSNSINRTFNDTRHKSFSLSGDPYTNSTCYAIATYLNGTVQNISESAKFQEILLADNNSNFIYMTILEQNLAGFDNSVYDFQAIVAEDETSPTPTTYYFYVELI